MILVKWTHLSSGAPLTPDWSRKEAIELKFELASLQQPLVDIVASDRRLGSAIALPLTRQQAARVCEGAPVTVLPLGLRGSLVGFDGQTLHDVACQASKHWENGTCIGFFLNCAGTNAEDFALQQGDLAIPRHLLVARPRPLLCNPTARHLADNSYYA